MLVNKCTIIVLDFFCLNNLTYCLVCLQVEPLVDASVGAAAIFSNSAIDLNGVCYLNDKMNAQVKQEPTDYLYAEPDLVSSV